MRVVRARRHRHLGHQLLCCLEVGLGLVERIDLLARPLVRTQLVGQRRLGILQRLHVVAKHRAYIAAFRKLTNRFAERYLRGVALLEESIKVRFVCVEPQRFRESCDAFLCSFELICKLRLLDKKVAKCI